MLAIEVYRLGLAQRVLAVEKRPSLDVSIDRIDAGDAIGDEFGRADTAFADVGGRLRERKFARAHDLALLRLQRPAHQRGVYR